MDEKEIVASYGNDITFWGGFDVQHIIPYGTVQQVRDEVDSMFECYYRPEGGFIFTAGNGINGDCPVDSLEALYDQAFKAAELRAGT